MAEDAPDLLDLVATNEWDSSALYIPGSVGPGQIVENAAGSIVIAGGVDSGAVVRAAGDVVVNGLLRGHAVAGCFGRLDARVTALQPGVGCTVSVGGQQSVGCGPGRPFVASTTPDGRTLFQVHSAAPLPVGTVLRHLLAPEHAAARTAVLTGLYITAAGLCAFVAPVTTFATLFALQGITPAWIQVLGVLATLFGVYYAGAAFGDVQHRGARGFYGSTVVGRLLLVAAFGWLYGSGRLAQPGLLVLAGLNLAGALSMWRALHKTESPRYPPPMQLV